MDHKTSSEEGSDIKKAGCWPSPGCHDKCGLLVTVKDGRIVKVRGNPDYGINNFTENGDGTITDEATGLIWDKNDSSEGLNWVLKNWNGL